MIVFRGLALGPPGPPLGRLARRCRASALRIALRLRLRGLRALSSRSTLQGWSETVYMWVGSLYRLHSAVQRALQPL